MFWDMRTKSLESQALEPLKSHEEMRGNTYPEDEAVARVVAKLQANAEYRSLFAGAFGSEQPVNAENLVYMNRSLIFALSMVILAVAGNRGVSSGLQQPSRPASQPPLRVAFTEKGFLPSSLPVRLNVPVRIAFVRQSDDLCATEVLIPEYNIKRDLPLNQPVVVELTPKKTGEIVFVCGMMAFQGKLVVTEK